MRYFFDIIDGDERTRDEVGLDLADDAEAGAEATRLLVELARDGFDGMEQGMFAIEVRVGGSRPKFLATLRLDFSYKA